MSSSCKGASSKVLVLTFWVEFFFSFLSNTTRHEQNNNRLETRLVCCTDVFSFVAQPSSPQASVAGRQSKRLCCTLETRFANNHLLKNSKTPPCKESYNGAAQVTKCGVNLVNLSLSYRQTWLPTSSTNRKSP